MKSNKQINKHIPFFLHFALKMLHRHLTTFSHSPFLSPCFGLIKCLLLLLLITKTITLSSKSVQSKIIPSPCHLNEEADDVLTLSDSCPLCAYAIWKPHLYQTGFPLNSFWSSCQTKVTLPSNITGILCLMK